LRFSFQESGRNPARTPEFRPGGTTGFCEVNAHRHPMNLEGSGEVDIPKPYAFIGFGSIHGPWPYTFVRFRWAFISQTPVLRNIGWDDPDAPSQRTWDPALPRRSPTDSVELSHSVKVSDSRRNTPKSGKNRSESLCAGLWVPHILGLVWGLNGPGSDSLALGGFLCRSKSASTPLSRSTA
jgi:hypothetical protein